MASVIQALRDKAKEGVDDFANGFTAGRISRRIRNSTYIRPEFGKGIPDGSVIKMLEAYHRWQNYRRDKQGKAAIFGHFIGYVSTYLL